MCHANLTNRLKAYSTTGASTVETNSRICLAAELGLWEIVLGEVDWIGCGESTETGLCHVSRQFDEQAESLFHVSTCSGRSGVRIIRGGAAAPCLTNPMRFPVS